MELREAHRYVTHKDTDKEIAVGDTVVVLDDKLRRGLWKLGRIEGMITGADNRVRGARVRVYVDTRKTSVIQGSVSKLYPLEIRSEANDQSQEKFDVAENTQSEQSLQRRQRSKVTARTEKKIKR